MKRKIYIRYSTSDKITALALFAILMFCSAFAVAAMFSPVAANPDAKWTDHQAMSFNANTAATLPSSRDQGR